MKLPHVFYDADGTLFDSLPAHILFLHDMNTRFKGGLRLPDPLDHEASKLVVATPMSEFLIHAGFPQELVDPVLEIYKSDFNTNPRYSVDFFPRIPYTIRRLDNKTFKQGIISANYLDNIRKVLARERLNTIFRLVVDRKRLDETYSGSKANYLKFYYNNLGLSPKEVIYIGDLKGDLESAREAGVNFIGVSWGWGFSTGDDTGFPIARSPKELEELILSKVQR